PLQIALVAAHPIGGRGVGEQTGDERLKLALVGFRLHLLLFLLLLLFLRGRLLLLLGRLLLGRRLLGGGLLRVLFLGGRLLLDGRLLLGGCRLLVLEVGVERLQRQPGHLFSVQQTPPS